MDQQPGQQEQQNTTRSSVPPQQYVAVPTPLSESSAEELSSKKIYLITAVIVIVAALLVGGGLLFMRKSSNTVQHEDNSVLRPMEDVAGSPDETLKRLTNPKTGERWLEKPKAVAKQGFLAENSEESAMYYEVGKRGNRTIYMTVDESADLFEKDIDGSVVAIHNPNVEEVVNIEQVKHYQTYLAPGVTIDTAIHYDSLSYPREFAIGKDYKVVTDYFGVGMYSACDNDCYAGQDLYEVMKLGRSTLMRSERLFSDTGLTSIGYFVQTPLDTTLTYYYVPLEADLDGYQWSAGSIPYENDKLKAISRGCGGMFASVTRVEGLRDSDVRKVGQSPSKLPVYEFRDNSHTVLVKAHEELLEFYRDFPDQAAGSNNITKDEFIRQHGIVLYKDKFDQWLVYVREKLAPVAGCAKPVVYLYPTQAQSVSVRVGADVKISEPHYDATAGWPNVWAQPDGQLQVLGKTYDSLFWEGPGIGQYPAINKGVIVKRSETLATIRLHLVMLGLNAKEINDFITYWQDKMPEKPYVRLTWLTTDQLEQLAPLRISPKPDTVIRVFLDYTGLDKPYVLPAQTLTSIPRQGFTVVEWGGLSPKRLY